MKLTQYLQIMMYFNLQYPSNYLSFLKYFSSDVFSIVYNPFDRVYQNEETCTPPWSFMESGNSCYLLKDNGHLVIIAATLIGLKIISKIVLISTRNSPTIGKYSKKVDTFLGADFVAMLLDSTLFDVFLSAVLNIRALTLDIPYHTVNLVLSIVCAVFYLCEFAFVILYSILRPRYNGNLGKGFKESLRLNQIANVTNSKTLRDSSSPSKALGLIDQVEKVSFKTNFSSENPKEHAKVAPIQSKWDKLKQRIGSMNFEYYFEDSNTEHFTGRYRVVLMQSRAIFSCILVVLTFSYPFLQVISITATHLTLAVKENIKTLYVEGMLSLCMVLCIPLIQGTGMFESPADRYNYIGHILMGLTSLLFVGSIVVLIYENIQFGIGAYKAIFGKKDIKNLKFEDQPSSNDKRNSISNELKESFTPVSPVTAKSLRIKQRASVLSKGKFGSPEIKSPSRKHTITRAPSNLLSQSQPLSTSFSHQASPLMNKHNK